MANENLLYNVQTRAPEALPEEDLSAAVLAGTHSFKKGVEIPVLDPSGAPGTVPAENVRDALSEGYKIETPKQGAIREFLDDNKGMKGTAKVFIGKAVDEGLMGIPGVIFDKTGDPFEVAKAEALKKDHQLATAAGSVAGFGGSLFIGGPLFKGASAAGQVAERAVAQRLAAAGVERGAQSLAKDLVARSATKAAQLGVEGAIVAAPRAITEASLGDPQAAGESLLYGLGLGAVLGTVGGPLGKGMKSLAEKAAAFSALEEGAPGWFQSFQNERASKALGFTKGQIKKLKGGDAEARGLGGDVLNMRLSNGEKILGALDDTPTIAAKVEQKLNEAGQKIDLAYTAIDDSGLRLFDPQKLNARLESELGAKYRDAFNRDETHLLDNLIDSVKGRGETPLSLSEAKGLLDGIDSVAYPKGRFKAVIDPTPKQEIAQKARRIIREQLNAAAKTGADALGKPEIAEALLQGNLDATKLIRVRRAIEDKLSSEQGNKFFGLTDTIAGVGAGAGAGVLPGIAVVGAKKLAEKYGNQVLANLPNEGLLFVEQAMRKAALKLDEIPSGLDSLVSKIGRGAGPARPAEIDALSRVAGHDDEKAPKEMHVKKLIERVEQFVQNQGALSSKVAELSAPIGNLGAPAAAGAFVERAQTAMKYLSDAAPKQNEPPNPFHDSPWKPTDAQVAAFARKVEILTNPFSAIDRLKDGTLTQDHMKALQAIYPSIYDAMRSRVVKHATSSKKKMPYAARLKLSLLMGTGLDPTLHPQAIKLFQDAFAPAEPAQPDSKMSALNLSQSTSSDMQKLES